MMGPAYQIATRRLYLAPGLKCSPYRNVDSESNLHFLSAIEGVNLS
jgi:hypothetical protein